MLADYCWAAFTRFHVLGQEQYPTGIHVWPYIQHDLISDELGRIEDKPGPRVRRQSGRWQAANHFVPQVATMELGCFFPTLRRGGIRFTPELLSPVGRFANQRLSEVY